MISRSQLINRLDKATDKAASLAIQRGVPISNEKVGIWVGNTLIKKNKIDCYDIYGLNKKLLFSNISVFDVATIIAQRYTAGEFKVIEKILILEQSFSKHHTDMIHYLYCMRAAKRRREYDTMSILEDKFQISDIRAHTIRDRLSFFKRVK